MSPPPGYSNQRRPRNHTAAAWIAPPRPLSPRPYAAAEPSVCSTLTRNPNPTSNTMKNPRVGQRIRTSNVQGYERSKTYTVSCVDPGDNTLRATDSTGREGNWIKWSQCREVGPDISWEWLKSQIPGDVLELLSAFNGLENLQLRPEVRDHILLQLPDLKRRILESQLALFEGDDLSQPSESEDDDEEDDLQGLI